MYTHYDQQETKENFVFPDKLVFAQLNTNAIDLERNWTKSAKHFSYFDWNSAKMLQAVVFYFHWKNSQKALRFVLTQTFWTPTQRELHQSKKSQHVDLLTSTY